MAFRATSLNHKVKIQRQKDDYEPMTIVDFFNQTIENFSNHQALANRDENGNWNKISYRDYKNRVEKIAKIFIKLGLEQRGVVAILAWNCPEWVIAALGAIHAGGVVTGIYTTNSSSACQYILEASGTQILIIDDLEQLQKINEIKVDLPHLKHIILINELNLNFLENAILNWNELMLLNTDDVDDAYVRRLNEIVPNECCTVIYTSGTSGNSKGVMLTHDNILWNARKSLETMKSANMGNESITSYLPLSHTAAFMGDIILAILCAGTVYFTDIKTLKSSLLKTLQEVMPTSFVGVPRVYEKIEEKLNVKISEFGFMKRRIFTWAQNIILQHHFTLDLSLLQSVKYELADRLIIRKVKEALGFQNCKLFLTGSAPMSVKTKKFFISLNMPIFEAYGMTESSGVHSLTSQHINMHSLESVGKCLQGAETKIYNQGGNQEGEICIRGRHVFMGYLNDNVKTFETIDDDGWLHTGDVGRMDEIGLIYVTGRLKEIVITSGGENIPAARIENLIKLECSAISNALLVGDKRKFLTMLVTLKTEMDEDGMPRDELASETCKWLNAMSLNYTKLSEIFEMPDVKITQALQQVIDRVNAKAISNPQIIQKFAILPHDFSIPTNELTATLKVKRHVVLEKYENLINKFYE